MEMDSIPSWQLQDIVERSNPAVIHRALAETTAGEELSTLALERYDPQSETKSSRRLRIILMLAKVTKANAMTARQVMDKINALLPYDHTVEIETVRSDIIGLSKDGRINAFCERGIRGWVAWGKYA